MTDLAIYALYIGIFVAPIDVLINFTEQFQKGFAGFKRFLEIVRTEPEVRDKPGAQPLKNVVGNIKYSGVSFAYDEGTHVFRNIDVEIGAGRTIALVGPSGGGKTTFCSLLPRFYDVTGRLRFHRRTGRAGCDLKILAERHRHRAAGCVYVAAAPSGTYCLWQAGRNGR